MIRASQGGSEPVEKRGEGSAQEVQGMWNVAGLARTLTDTCPRFLQGTEDLSAK